MAPEQDRALEEIRREVIESRNLVIKTDNQLKTLHAELKNIGRRQDEVATRQFVSSGVAYVLFALLCAAGAFGIVSARSTSTSNDRERLEKQVTELTVQLDKQKLELQERERSARAAGEVFRQMSAVTNEDRLRGVEGMSKLDNARLSTLERRALEEKAEVIRRDVGQNALDRGRNAYRKQDYNSAVEDLSRFLSLSPTGDDAIEASFFLGSALLQTRKAEQAIPHLARFVKEDKRSKIRDYGMLLLSQAYDATGQADKAVQVARDALAAFPGSDFAGQFRVRLANASAHRAEVPAPAAAAPTSAPISAPTAAARPADAGALPADAGRR